MNDVSEESLYGLIEIAERQQGIAQTVLEGMFNERMAMEAERKSWSDQIAELQGQLRSAVSNAVSDTLISAEEAGAAAVMGATDSLKSKLDDVNKRAEQVEMALRAWVRWLSWRVLTLAIAGMALLGLLWWLASCAILWWDTSAIGSAQMRKAQLQVEIAQLQANRDAWVDAGMLNKILRCGPERRPCVRTEPNSASFGSEGDYRIIRTK